MSVMKLLLSAVWAASAVSHTLESNPLGKVIELLDSLAAKITKEGEAEAKAYKEFVEWCDDASKNKGFEIKTATAKKAELEAAIQKNSGDIEASTAKIEELASSIATGEADMKSAHTIREKEAADFKATESELMDVIDTLSRAITVMKEKWQRIQPLSHKWIQQIWQPLPRVCLL
jgi:molecular chaperone GrpE (heat shock protein)